MELTFKKISPLNICGIAKARKILYTCGKDLAKKQDLHHWDNSHFKWMVIMALCALKNNIYLAIDENKKAVATIQSKVYGDTLKLEKGGTLPSYQGQGVFEKVMNYQKEIARQKGCTKLCLEVYEKSEKSFKYFLKLGYRVVDTCETKNYKLARLEIDL